VRDSQVSAKVLRELGRRVRSARIALDLTQEQAAAAADIDYKHWQAIEAGRANATMRTLVHVARALRMTVWELLGPEAPVEEPKRARVRRRRS
jgi:transcriptional regulator with XRE-family HTH domain